MKFIQSTVQQFVNEHNALMVMLSLFMITSTTHVIDMMIHPYNEVYKTYIATILFKHRSHKS